MCWACEALRAADSDFLRKNMALPIQPRAERRGGRRCWARERPYPVNEHVNLFRKMSIGSTALVRKTCTATYLVCRLLSVPRHLQSAVQDSRGAGGSGEAEESRHDGVEMLVLLRARSLPLPSVNHCRQDSGGNWICVVRPIREQTCLLNWTHWEHTQRGRLK